jgi:putative protease
LKTIKKIELLAPAKNKETGKEAILHGADAVYIGVRGFSARAAAGNSAEDIAELIEFAHLYNARVYVALNTILYDNELTKVEKLIHELYRANADALIIQDMGILQLNLPPIPLHASTQTDNRTAEKVQFLEKAGFSQVVLARELSIDEILYFASQSTLSIEVFVHGALCVSYSGQCYVSQAVTKRSANRGECAQLCRLPYDLVDSYGKVIRRNEHLLSLKDFNQFDNLERLLDAGAVSLKIEGRLKDASYVKNVVAAYRQKLDAIFEKRPEFMRASSGKSTIDFTPDLSKSFNRGFTDYFSHGRQPDICSFNSPKSIGEYIGTVREIDANSLTIKTKTELYNGDGLCFIDNNNLAGFRVNRAEENKIFPAQMPRIKTGAKLYRNYNHDFENRLSRPTATRKIAVQITVSETPFGFALQITDEDKNHATITAEFEKNRAQKPQKENIRTQLSKTGNTIFEVTDVYINYVQECFIPSSLLVEWRKALIEKLLSVRKINYHQEVKKTVSTSHDYPEKQLTYLGNVSNEKSRMFYTQHNTQVLQSAFEQVPQKNKMLMFSKYCVKYALGYCPKETKKPFEFQEPLYLTNERIRLQLTFDCKKCEMYITMCN